MPKRRIDGFLWRVRNPTDTTKDFDERLRDGLTKVFKLRSQKDALVFIDKVMGNAETEGTEVTLATAPGILGEIRDSIVIVNSDARELPSRTYIAIKNNETELEKPKAAIETEMGK